MKGLSAKFQEALDELRDLYASDGQSNARTREEHAAHERASHVSQAVQQSLLHLEKWRTGEFNPGAFASVRWPAEPTKPTEPTQPTEPYAKKKS